MSHIQKLLNILIRVGALKHGEFRDNLVTLDPEGLKLLSLTFLYHVRKVISIKAIGGPTPSAEYLVRALCQQSNQDGESPIPAFTVSEECIEGGLQKNIPVAIVNTTCVTGASLLKMITNIEGLGHKVVLVIVLVDFCKGGREKLRGANRDFVSLFVVTPEGLAVSTK